MRRPSGLIKSGGSAITFYGNYLDWGKECFIGVNINNWSKLLCDITNGQGKQSLYLM
jgi:hypothetical protein